VTVSQFEIFRFLLAFDAHLNGKDRRREATR
jgi:hypothetical protein